MVEDIEPEAELVAVEPEIEAEGDPVASYQQETESHTPPLWTLDAMGEATKGWLPDGDTEIAITGLSIDTRSLQPGDAYFAIRGDVHDGHKFVAAAHAAGATVSVVAKDWVGRLEGDCGRLLVVDDVLHALVRLGLAARARTSAQVVAITGSVGKTTTKEMLRTGLAACGHVHAAVASFNNHWGVPLTLARMPADSDFAVIEIGMNHPGEITPLVQMTRPHVAIINNVAAVHLGAFDSVDEIAHAKSEIFDGLIPGGTAVLNADDERLPIMLDRATEAEVANTVLFGEAPDADVRLEKLNLMDHASTLSANVMGEPVMLKVGAPGRHIAQNALVVLAVAKLFDADLAKVSLALAEMEAVKGRGQQHKLSVGQGAAVLIDESYNANPTSMAASLDLLGSREPAPGGRRIAVLGDMLELGATSAQLHADIADPISDNRISRVFLAGSDMRALRDTLMNTKGVHVTWCDTADEIGAILADEIRSGDVVMVKASLGMAFAKVINHLLERYGDKPDV
ncbi:UDP-N-acetylmuramoylalanyl-D-glutamyl-2,6-diaminopimelate--D-alanyl-D-alanine ligase [Ahrensia sp. R2A130]|uniref:UDP-N-acetylmuramoylalanyl-D-glutamyl-2, 6-diaminopimelate--D-alanyl-D-alanine ligase n=1 Tax=Ahrensia sp. R2A130 TaxID=744979 RepID=UPI0021100C90|nr:UDP-N-acetylmuramoylalanyl-D-glutamyl-2,6-diaminopimelate--D-alanyl-D-alanine ligase [Ahrensia sp. R2A130]